MMVKFDAVKDKVVTYGAAHVATIYYISASAILTIVIKVLLDNYGGILRAPLLLLAQGVVTLVVVSALSIAGTFTWPSFPHHHNCSLRNYMLFVLSYAFMLCCSLLALQLTSLLMYNTLRRTSIVFVVATHAIVHREFPQPLTLISAVITVFGAFIAGRHDLTFDLTGYTLAIAANFASAMYLVLMSPVRDQYVYTNLQLLSVNTVYIFPLLVAFLFSFSPKPSIVPYLVADARFVILFILSSTLGMIVTHSIYVNTTVNDAITQTVSAQIKDFVLLITSYVLLRNSNKMSTGNVVGACISFCGALVYAYGKARNAGSSTRTYERVSGDGDEDEDEDEDPKVKDKEVIHIEET